MFDSITNALKKTFSLPGEEIGENRDICADEIDENKKETCSICIEEIDENDKIISLHLLEKPVERSDKKTETMKNHLFHPRCINPWFSKADTCPICKQKVETTSQPIFRAKHLEHLNKIALYKNEPLKTRLWEALQFGAARGFVLGLQYGCFDKVTLAWIFDRSFPLFESTYSILPFFLGAFATTVKYHSFQDPEIPKIEKTINEINLPHSRISSITAFIGAGLAGAFALAAVDRIVIADRHTAIFESMVLGGIAGIIGITNIFKSKVFSHFPKAFKGNPQLMYEYNDTGIRKIYFSAGVATALAATILAKGTSTSPINHICDTYIISLLSMPKQIDFFMRKIFTTAFLSIFQAFDACRKIAKPPNRNYRLR